MFHRTTFYVDLCHLPVGKDSVPTFLPPIISFIEENIDEEGIFRKNGSRSQVYKINEAISQHVPYIPEESTVHDVGSFLKLWLINLPEPLISPSIVVAHYGTDIITSTNDILSHISFRARVCVARIFSLLKKILDHSDKNQMNFPNLSTCFVLSLMQHFKNYPKSFNFKLFFECACNLLNEDGTDFKLNNGLNSPLLLEPKRRERRQFHSQCQRRNIGFVRKSDIMAALPKDIWVVA